MKIRSSLRGAACSVAALAAPVLHAQPIEEIRVVATPHDQSPTDVAQSVTVLSGDSLRRAQSATLGETLAGELGVSSTYFGAGSSRPVIRGLAGERVKITEDGIDALDVSSTSADHAVGIDPLAAQQIEIFRGPTTLLYGSGAVGGVVNTVTNRIPEAPPPDGFDGAVELRANSVSQRRSGAVKLDGGADYFAWHLDASRGTTDDYEVPSAAELGGDATHPAGVVPNSDVETSSGAVGAAWLGARGSFGLAVSGLDSRYGVPGADGHEPSALADAAYADAASAALLAGAGPDALLAAADAVRIDLEQTRVDLRADWLGFSRFPEIELRAGVNDYAHVELEGAEIGTRFLSDAYEGRVEVLHAPWGAWRGAFGAQLGERELAAIGDEAFLPPLETSSAGAFVLEYRDVGTWRVSLGARIERVRHDASGSVRRFSASATSVSAAFIRRLAGGLALSVNAAKAERVPSAEELFSNGPHLASGTFEVGTPALGVETSQHLDVGLRWTEGRVTWALTAFRTAYDDFIYLAATGAEDAASGLPIYRYVQRDAHLVGVEAELLARIAEVGAGEIDARLYADGVGAELSGGDRLPRIPPRRVGLRVQYHDSRLLAGIEAVRYADQSRTAVFETPTEGYTLLGFDLAWTLREGTDRPVDLFVKGTNLLDEEARKHTSIVKELAPLPGRGYAIGVRASF